MKRVLLLVVSIRTIDAGACYNATANAALLRQGAALQCAGAATKMPCLDLQRPTLPPRLFHLHLSKMNGRSVLDRAPGVTGLPRCPWTRSSGGTSTFRRGDALRDRLRSAAGTRASRCVTSFETHWDAAVDMAMGDGGPAPLFLTVLRAPRLGRVQGQAQDAAPRRGLRARRRLRGADAALRRHRLPALRAVAPRAPGAGDRVAGCDGAAAPRAWTARQRIDVAVARLEASVFGVQEHMEATYCLWKYQFGAAAHGTSSAASATAAARRGAGPRGTRSSASPRPSTRRTRRSSRSSAERAWQRARLYARADELFRDRCDAVEAATSVKLLCDDSYVVSPAPTAPTAAPTARARSEGGRGRERRRAGAAPRGGGHVPRRPCDDGGRAGDSGRARRGVALMCVI
ncbi:hypothetical protein JL720_4240 [Aureococcus anophagefferens]|nr:hypothetical protein JL720_4240 [Aureococcus anophagefferens]